MANITPETTIVLITGANQGIGFQVAKKLATEHPDYHIILSGRRSEAVQEATQTLEKQGIHATPLVLDVDSDESIKAAVETVQDKFGRLDVLINNGAISGFHMKTKSRQHWQAVLSTNVTGVALTTDAFLPLLSKSNKTKRVLFVSSTLGSLTLKADAAKAVPWRKDDYGPYTVSKAALNMLGLHYAVAYEDDKTWKFNIVDPGHHCGTTLNDFHGAEDPALGAVSICDMATQGPDGQSGIYVNDRGVVPW